MTFMTRTFIGFIFAVEPIWVPLLIVDAATLLVLVFKERFDPRTLIFWISTTVILPFLGTLLYILFGCTLIGGRIFERKRRSDAHPGDGACGVPTDIRVYRCFSDAVPDMASDMASARSVRVMLRRIPSDRAFHEAMADAAASGKEVLLMTSSFGFGRTRGLRRLRAAGVEYATFRNRAASALSLRPAYRNMRSMAVIDDRIAYVCSGTVLRLEGPAAGSAGVRFASDWAFAVGTEPAAECSCDGSDVVSVISSGPDCGGEADIASYYARLLNSSRSRVVVTAPYLTPGDDLYSHLKLLVLSGVEVDILLPRRGAHWHQSWNSLAASNPLMIAGARVLFTDEPVDGFMMMSDGTECAVSSGSYTTRSLRDDFNICIAVRSEDACRAIMAGLESKFSGAVECLPEEYSRRSVTDMVRIAASRMLMFLNRCCGRPAPKVRS